MQAVKSSIGGVEVLIEAISDELEIVGSDDSDERQTRPTAIADKLAEAYRQAKLVIKNVAEDVATEFQSMKAASRPKQVDMEFGLGLSGKAGVWVVTGEANSALKVKMTWRFEQDEQSS